MALPRKTKTKTKTKRAAKLRRAAMIAPAAKRASARTLPTKEDLAARLFRSGPPSYIADLDGNILYASGRYEKMAQETLGPRHDPRQPAFDLSAVIVRILAGEKQVVERDVAPIMGTNRNYWAHHYPILGAGGEIEGVGGIYRETSHEWRDIQRIRARYDDMTRLSFDIVWETDAESVLTFVSPRATEILGYHPRELIGQTIHAFGAFDGVADPIAAGGRKPFRDLPVATTHRDGRIRMLKLSGLPMFAEGDGSFLGFRGTATDVSTEAEARASAVQSRDRLTTAIENISEGFALYDGHDRLVLCNGRLREYLTGVERTLFPGAPFQGTLQALAEGGYVEQPGDAVQAWRALHERARRDGEADIEFALAGGRWLRVTARPTNGSGTVCIMSDITEAKEREGTLRAARDLAEQGSRAKSEFLANMSHELRTPLNAIIGFSEIMHTETMGPIGNPRYLEYLGDIIESGKHLLGVINDILDVAKSEAGKLELNEELVDIAEELKTTGRMFGEQAAEAEVEVELTVEAPAGLAKLWADRRKIRQILLNLVSNAIKFTPAGGRVTVGAANADDGGLAIVVADTGIGIRKEDIPRAFAPFGQVDSSLARRYEGTGLGLPLTKSLVERHGGRLDLESEPGKGTRVTVYFPRERRRD